MIAKFQFLNVPVCYYLIGKKRGRPFGAKKHLEDDEDNEFMQKRKGDLQFITFVFTVKSVFVHKIVVAGTLFQLK